MSVLFMVQDIRQFVACQCLKQVDTLPSKIRAVGIGTTCTAMAVQVERNSGLK